MGMNDEHGDPKVAAIPFLVKWATILWVAVTANSITLFCATGQIMATRRRWNLLAAMLCCMLVAHRASGAVVHHVLIISIDGLHEADLNDPALRMSLLHLTQMAKAGVHYTHASTPVPSDSFPCTLAYCTGAGPATTGVYYDQAYYRDLVPPDAKADTKPGAVFSMTEEIDKDNTLLSGGGDSGAGSIDPTKLPRLASDHSKIVWPNDVLKVNTIFEVVHEAGLRTALMDKHPAYQIMAGPSGKGLDYFYSPEIDAKARLSNGEIQWLEDASSPRVKGQLSQIEPKHDPDLDLMKITHDANLARFYDDLKVKALQSLIWGTQNNGTTRPGMPALIVMNFQAVNIAQKSLTGGIDVVDGKEQPSKELLDALSHTDECMEAIQQNLENAGLWNDTLVIVLGKHGQNPRVGKAKALDENLFKTACANVWNPIRWATQDDVSLIWLGAPAHADWAAGAINNLRAKQKEDPIAEVLWGDSLKKAGLMGDPDRTPDVIVTLKPGFVLMDKANKRAEHGGFGDDDTQVPIILSGGAIDPKLAHVNDEVVNTRQIAVTALIALGIDPAKLQGAAAEKTPPLPGAGFDSH